MCPFIDIMITFMMITVGETIPMKWIQRRSFINSRKLLIIVWFVMASILSWGYRCVLQKLTFKIFAMRTEPNIIIIRVNLTTRAD